MAYSVLHIRLANTVPLVTFVFVLFTASLPVDAQQVGKVYRIGVFRPGGHNRMVIPPTMKRFHKTLGALGWVEGQNLVLEKLYGTKEQYAEIATELVRRKVDVIFVSSTARTRAVVQATKTIPIVFVAVSDPVGSGFVESIARPGGNATGFTTLSSTLSGKQLELLKEAMPRLSQAAVLWTPNNPANSRVLKETQDAAETLGVTIHPIAVRMPNDFASAFATMTQKRAEALIVLLDTMIVNNRSLIADLALQHQLPTMFNFTYRAQHGGLLSYGPSIPAMYERAAYYVDKIIRGAKPGDLPVEQPITFEFVINQKTAKTLGLSIPPILLYQADQVIR